MAILTIIRQIPSHILDSANMHINPRIPVENFKREPKKFDYSTSTFFLVATLLTLLLSASAKYTGYNFLNFDSFYVGKRNLYINEQLDTKGTVRPRFERFVFFEGYNLGVKQFESIVLPIMDFESSLEQSPCVVIADFGEMESTDESKEELVILRSNIYDCKEKSIPYYSAIGTADRVDINYGHGIFTLENVEIHLNKFQLGYGFISTEFSNVDTKLFSNSVYIAWILLFMGK
jgi:hypothetical protein